MQSQSDLSHAFRSVSTASTLWLCLVSCAPPTGDPIDAPASGQQDLPVAGQTTDAPRDPAVDTIFADLDGSRPGAAVAVRHQGRIVHLAGYGIANMDHQIPITPDTVFDIASISKQFGAMSALLLQAEGLLDLDEDVRTYVPELPDLGATITARHLLHHTSGIRDWPHTMSLGGVEMSDVISFEKILRMLYHQQAINFPPGSEYAYTNTGYNLLARIIEIQSGLSFREFTESRIFEPLEMASSHFSDDYLEIIAGRAESYAPLDSDSGTGFRRQVNQLTALASSSLHTTARDFAKWMQNYETGKVGGREILDRMVERGVLNDGEVIDYAFGLSVGEYRGLATFGHGGSWAGFRTNFIRFPDQDLSVIVLCNVSDCEPARRSREIAEAYLQEVMAPAKEAEVEDEPDATGPTLSDEQLREFTGDFRSAEVDSTYQMEIDEGQLVARHWRNVSTILTPSGEDTFTGDQRWFPEIRFSRDSEGRVSGFVVNGVRVRNLVFDRVR